METSPPAEFNTEFPGGGSGGGSPPSPISNQLHQTVGNF